MHATLQSTPPSALQSKPGTARVSRRRLATVGALVAVATTVLAPSADARRGRGKDDAATSSVASSVPGSVAPASTPSGSRAARVNDDNPTSSTPSSVPTSVDDRGRGRGRGGRG